MSHVTRENLKKLLDYGLIAEHEQDKILFSFDQKSPNETKRSVLEVLERNIKLADDEDKRFESEKARIISEQNELAREIFELKKRKSKNKAEKEIEKYNSEKVAHLGKVQRISSEYRRALRRLDDFLAKAEKAVNERELSKIKTALK